MSKYLDIADRDLRPFARAVGAAMRGERPLTAVEICARAFLAPTTTKTVLEAMLKVGLVTIQHDRYSLTE